MSHAHRRIVVWAIATWTLAVSPSAYPPIRLRAQASPLGSAQDVHALALRLAAMTAVTGYEQALTDSLLTLLPGARRDRIGDVTLTFGRGAPARLVYCPVDEPGYVVGGMTATGYLTLRRVGRPGGDAPFDQQIEGHRVTLFGDRGAVPGVVGVRSVHLTRGRPTGDQPFVVDHAYVDVGATSEAEVAALGVRVLTPVALTKRPHRYGSDLLAAPVAGRRAACAALVAAALARPRVRGTVVVAFTVQSGLSSNPGLAAVGAVAGPFTETRVAMLPVRFTGTPVETVSLAAADTLQRNLVAWMEGR